MQPHIGKAFTVTAGKAFTIVEVLVAIVIMTMLGGIAVGALWFAFSLFSQTDDYITADATMEFAVQRLSREFSLIGLGMPNNRKGQGSFSLAFRNGGGDAPIMALMGTSGSTTWGGPVTVANDNPLNAYTAAAITGTWSSIVPGGGAFVGPELYYAWGVPTGVKGTIEKLPPPPDEKPKISAGNTVSIDLVSSTGTAANLQNFFYDGRKIALNANNAGDPASWVIFPTLRLPLLVTGMAGNHLTATVAPGATPMTGTLMELDEVHLVQAARLYRNTNGELIRIIFGSNDTTSATNTTDHLAYGIVGLQFTYNPASRLLTMYIAARGGEKKPVPSGQPPAWPSWLPPISSDDLRYRVLVKSLTWRIRN